MPLLKPMQLPDRGLLVQSASLTCSRLTPYDCGAAVISRSAGAQITGVRVGLGTDQITTTISTTEYQFGSNFRYLRVHLDEREKRESESTPPPQPVQVMASQMWTDQRHTAQV